MCYEEGVRMDARFRGHDSLEEGVKWLKTSEKTTIQAIPEANPSDSAQDRRPKKLRVLLRTFGWPLV